MADTPYLSEIKIFSFNFAPRGWAMCNGQLLPINQNQALFSLLGTTFGGDGRINFALPDLRGKVPLHMGSIFTLGQSGGEENHTLSSTEMPSHTHQLVASANSPNANTIGGNLFASNTGFKPYSVSTNESMNPGTVSTVGGSQSHNNMTPYLVLTMCVALQGIFPSRN